MRAGLGKPSLVRRLIWLAAAWSLLALAVTGVLLTATFQQAALRRFELGLADVTQGLLAGSTVDNGQVLAPPLTDARALRAYSGRYWQIAEHVRGGDMRPLVRSRSLFDQELDAPQSVLATIAADPGTPVYYDVSGPMRQPLRAMALQVTLPGRAAPVILMSAEDRSPIDAEAGRFGLLTAAALVVLGVGIIAAVFIQVRVGLRPLFDLQREVAEVRKGKADALAGDYPVELEPLAVELNALVAHNQEVVERQRTHVGNLAHALKTPLSVMLTEASQRPSPLAEVVAHQAELMRGQVDHHLRRARAAARSQSLGERTLVDPVLEELAHTLEQIFRDKGVVIDWRCPEDLCFRGERQDLLELAGNVMENAAKWCRGKVRVTAAPSGEGRFALAVEDDGPGLPPERRGEVVKRGARLDESAPGSGLGLNIVDELARAYDGALALSDSALGGLKVELVLPRAES